MAQTNDEEEKWGAAQNSLSVYRKNQTVTYTDEPMFPAEPTVHRVHHRPPQTNHRPN